MSGFAFTVREADWQTDAQSLRAIRHEVFIVEQNVPAELEFTGDDDQHHHVIAINAQGDPIGTARLSAAGKIGRMAVLKNARRKGVGSAMLNMLIAIAKIHGHRAVTLSSQLHALPFYKSFGFVESGETFIEAGIDHIKMLRPVT
ncbi:GNAT family N-acetyltransferase [Mariniblastus sp.]|nr:GNAT family N-acetyltransferase [Mariniblastus sp.]